MSETRLPPFTPGQERFGLAVVKLMNRVNTWVYRLTNGRIGGRFLRGAPVCLLTVRDRKTGEPRTVALLHLADGDDVIVVASLGGMSKHPLWYRNLEANPDVTLQIGATERTTTARRVFDEEKEARGSIPPDHTRPRATGDAIRGDEQQAHECTDEGYGERPCPPRHRGLSRRPRPGVPAARSPRAVHRGPCRSR